MAQIVVGADAETDEPARVDALALLRREGAELEADVGGGRASLTVEGLRRDLDVGGVEWARRKGELSLPVRELRLDEFGESRRVDAEVGRVDLDAIRDVGRVAQEPRIVRVFQELAAPADPAAGEGGRAGDEERDGGAMEAEVGLHGFRRPRRAETVN